MKRQLPCLVLLAALMPSVAAAQFYNYPSFQPPQISSRDYNFGVADAGDAGTSLVFQWRESMSTRSHLQFDVGLADPDAPRSPTRFIIGGGFAQRVHASTDNFPLEIVGTIGIGGAFGGGNSLVRIPVGASIGKRFALDAPIFVTPYVHPRLSVDYCNRCGRDSRGDTDVGIDVDLGVSFEVSRSIALRASGTFVGGGFAGRDNMFGVSLAWTPAPIR